MLENWLSSSDPTDSDSIDTIGQVVKTRISATDKGSQPIHIISDNSEFARNSKQALYLLKNHFDNLELYDLGTLKNDNPEFIIGLLRELLPAHGRIIVLAKKDNYLDSIFRALEYNQEHISMVYLNSNLDRILEDRTSRSLRSTKLLNLSALGYQRHYCSQKVLSYLHESFVHHLSLGQLRDDINRAEPILRSALATSIDTSILKSDLLGIPNGLYSLEICQLAKLCGMSATMKVLSISNTQSKDGADFAALVGQMIWYFIEGTYLSESAPEPSTKEQFQEHLVQTDYSNFTFTFWKSNQTGRWWFEIPDTDEKRGNIYPCNQEDYNLACRNEISEYILNQINLDH